MTRLKIKGNRKSYQLTNSIDYLNISLSGQFDFKEGDRVLLEYDGWHLTFKNNSSLLKFVEEVRGASFDKLILTLNKYDFEPSFIDELAKSKVTEIGLLKALFLIYHWIELPLSNPLYLELENRLFDEFVVDWTHEPQPQNDIYFISKKYFTVEYLPMLERLVDLNLLAELNIQRESQNKISAYFIPLIKPGVSSQNFATEFDKTGKEIYGLWKKILKDRDVRINNWINNRF